MTEKKSSQNNLMKDALGVNAIRRIGISLARVMPNFNADEFQKDAEQGIESLELKARVQHLIEVLHRHYKAPFKTVCAQLQQLPSVWDKGDSTDAKAGFAAWPVIDYVAVYGLEHPEESLALLAKLTPLFSAEFAIRPFIQKHPALTFSTLLQWCEHENEHVRRLASEGSRPRLPWGIHLTALIKNPEPLTHILQKLRRDDSLYVRRSVANSLNDISKDNIDWMITVCRHWKQEENKKTDWIIKHALRSLIKAGDERAFPLLGYSHLPETTVSNFVLRKNKIHLGDSLAFSFLIEGGLNAQSLVVDYTIYFMKANGKLAAKVFKLKNIFLAKNECLSISKQHSFKTISTRTYYSGRHEIAIHINGKEAIRSEFSLLT